MKIGVVGGGSMGDVYGPKYGAEFFQNLWKESLLDHLSTEDEVVWLEYSQMRDFDQAAGDFDAIIGAWIVDNMLSEELLEKHPHLHYVSTLAHGFGYIDPEVVRKHNLTVTNTVYGDVTIAQYAFALLMDICHDVHANDVYYRREKWLPQNHGKRMLVKTRQIELYEKTFGIVGLGNIGYCAAKIAQGFGMKVIAYSRHKKEGEKYDFIEQVSFDELLERSDVISIHCPLTESTRHLLDADAFKKMKDDVIIINTARGAIIDEEVLIENLENGKVYAAGLDVLTGEPLTEPAKIMKCSNTRLTEHIAWAPVESRIRSIRIGCENFLNWRAGHPTSVVV